MATGADGQGSGARGEPMIVRGQPVEPGARDEPVVRGRIRRTAPLASLTARTAGEAVVVALRSKLTGAPRTDFHVRTAERYAQLLGNSKGALTKAGQMLSFMSVGPAVPAGFQTAYQTALARLRSDAPPMAGELAREVLERELGRPAGRAFAEFDWEPLAAASIGQVHAARLHDGRAVAVKIQYPGVGEAIAADLKNNELLFTFLGLILGLAPRGLSLHLRSASREMSERIADELDYRLEAANQAEFAARYRGHPFIHVPDVIGWAEAIFRCFYSSAASTTPTTAARATSTRTPATTCSTMTAA
jgi:predicted unusual protein kinase regulating ubiquinone biosynthesis (AarF/ABC1/UbiB family)